VPLVDSPRVGRRSFVLDTHQLRWLFGGTLLLRLLYPFFSSPLDRLFSDPARHWDNALHFFQPSIMGSSDPYLYQVWLAGVQWFAGSSVATIQLSCGLLCAAMPYGWYRALKELLPKRWALGGAVMMGLTPSFIGFYAYFMNETLLLTLTGFAFWLTLRARRRTTVGAFVGACCLWVAVGYTRVLLWPAALLCLGWVLLATPRRGLKLLWGLLIFAGLAIPAGLHSKQVLGFFSPLGNPYLAAIYRHSGNKVIDVEFPGYGRYGFGSPSFYNPTFYPFSDWTTSRAGTASVVIDTSKGREDWRQEDIRVRAVRRFPRLRDSWENLLFLLFGQPWPANNWHTVMGALTVWFRWLWPPIIAIVAYGFATRRFVGREWLFPSCSILMLGLLMVQQDGIIEARYRLPIDPIMLAALILLWRRFMLARSTAAADT
jgi:hypothetical protein